MAESVVDLQAIAHNTALLAKAAGPAELMAVVKADGFAHGAGPVARTALGNGASWLGVTSAEEALSLRAAGLTAPVLMWLYAPDADLDDVVRARVDISAGSSAMLAAVVRAARRSGEPAYVHLKADTGMSRGGARPAEWERLLVAARRAATAGHIVVRAVWSHLASAENPDGGTVRHQLQEFRRAQMAAACAGVDVELTHIANSAAVLRVPAAHFDLVRAGIALYGVEPVPGRQFGLRPAMTVRAQVIQTKRVPEGTGVSYGLDYVTDRETTLGLIPLGFADGLPRVAAGKAEVAVRGRRFPIAGRISMDQIVVDLHDAPVHPGDFAVILGPGDNGEPTAEEWAGWAGTNAHEILTGIGPRLPRRYT
jgi:alanine racemase